MSWKEFLRPTLWKLIIPILIIVWSIRLFFSPIGPTIEPLTDVRDSLTYRQFVAQCQYFCNQYLQSGTGATAARFCYTKLTEHIDLNGNKKVDVITAETKILNICEDGIYCFHVVNCQNESVSIDWSDCRLILCNSYKDAYNDSYKATQEVKAIFPSAGTCTLNPNENWFYIYGFDNFTC
jgi:hypothetical protein